MMPTYFSPASQQVPGSLALTVAMPVWEHVQLLTSIIRNLTDAQGIRAQGVRCRCGCMVYPVPSLWSSGACYSTGHDGGWTLFEQPSDASQLTQPAMQQAAAGQGVDKPAAMDTARILVHELSGGSEQRDSSKPRNEYAGEQWPDGGGGGKFVAGDDEAGQESGGSEGTSDQSQSAFMPTTPPQLRQRQQQLQEGQHSDTTSVTGETAEEDIHGVRGNGSMLDPGGGNHTKSTLPATGAGPSECNHRLSLQDGTTTRQLKVMTNPLGGRTGSSDPADSGLTMQPALDSAPETEGERRERRMKEMSIELDRLVGRRSG